MHVHVWQARFANHTLDLHRSSDGHCQTPILGIGASWAISTLQVVSHTRISVKLHQIHRTTWRNELTQSNVSLDIVNRNSTESFRPTRATGKRINCALTN